MVEGARANKVSGVLVGGSLLGNGAPLKTVAYQKQAAVAAELRTSQKKEADLLVDLSTPFPVLPEQSLCAEHYSLMHLTEYASALLPAPLADAVMPFASLLKARQANPNPVALVSSLVFGELLQ